MRNFFFDKTDVDELLHALTTSKQVLIQDDAALRLAELGVKQILSPVGVIFCWRPRPEEDPLHWQVVGIHPTCGGVGFSAGGSFACTLNGTSTPAWAEHKAWGNMIREFCGKMYEFLDRSSQTPHELEGALMESARELKMFFEPL